MFVRHWLADLFITTRRRRLRSELNWRKCYSAIRSAQRLEDRTLLTNLLVTTSRFKALETDAAITATVHRSSSTGDMDVDLTSSDASQATVPASVTIPDGQSSASFLIVPVDDSVVDEHADVMITASSPGHGDGTTSVLIGDDEGPLIFTDALYSDIAAGSGAIPVTVSRVNADLSTTIAINNGPEGRIVALQSGETSRSVDLDFIGPASPGSTETIIYEAGSPGFYAIGTTIRIHNVTDPDGQFIGVDFGPNGDNSPINWNTISETSLPATVENVIDESGAVTGVDILVETTAGNHSYSSNVPPAGMLPSHTQSLTDLDGFLEDDDSVSITFNNLLEGSEYKAWAFHRLTVDNGQHVGWEGRSSGIRLNFASGEFLVNGRDATGMSLDDVAVTRTIDNDNLLRIHVDGVSDTAMVYGAAIQGIRSPRLVLDLPEAIGEGETRTATVYRYDTDVTNPLTVEFHVPTTTFEAHDTFATPDPVVIPAGQNSVTFPVYANVDPPDDPDTGINTVARMYANPVGELLRNSFDIAQIVDSTEAGFIVTESGPDTTVTEAGSTDTFEVELESFPLGDVYINITSNNPDEVTVSPSQLLFRPSNWDDRQTVTVSGVDDAVADGDALTGITLSIDDDLSYFSYRGYFDQHVDATTLDDESVGFTITESGGSTLVSEGGSTDMFDVVLHGPPNDDVVINVASADTGEVVVDQTSLTFTPADWDQPQTVLVTGVDDHLDDGDVLTTVTLSIDDANSPAGFHLLADEIVSVVTGDNDVAEFTVIETGGDTRVAEAGTTDSFSVFLDRPPASNVVLNIVSDDPGETATDHASLTFTPANWNQPQPAVVTGIDDPTVDGDMFATITLAVDDALSEDSFDGTPGYEFTVRNDDDDTAGFSVTESGGGTSVNEDGTTDSFDVVLDRQPLTNVAFDVTSDDPDVATVDVATLTFTPADWDVPQTVTVTGTDDPLIDADEFATITVSIDDAGSDDEFAVLGDQTVSVTNISDDQAGFHLVPAAFNAHETGFSSHFFVFLDAQPSSSVRFSVSSSNVAEIVPDASLITVSPSDWNIDNDFVFLDGQDDALPDGHQEVTITVAVDDIGSDDAFDPLPDQQFTILNLDDETADVRAYASLRTSVVDESGSPDSLSVRLNHAPASDVVLALSSSDTGEFVVAASQLTFTPSNWDTSQTVHVYGIDDPFADGDTTATLTISVVDALSDDAFDGVADVNLTVTTLDDEVAGFTVTETGGETSVVETGTTDTFSVVLDELPEGNVVINVTSDDTGEATVDVSSLTFTPANWNQAQTVTVTGVDDPTIDGDQTLAITLSVNDALSHDGFDPLPDQMVSVTTIDDDIPRFLPSETAGDTTVDESGTTDTFDVVLSRQPVTNVVIDVTSGDTGEATVDLASLTFTPANWNQPQTVTVTGVDDPTLDGDQTSTITLSVDDANSDDAFDSLPDDTISVTTTDDDVASFSFAITGPGTTVDESGTTDTFDVVLDRQPLTNVAIDVASGDTGEATVDMGSLTFTPANWDLAQTVTVTGVDDPTLDGDQTTTVTLSIDDTNSNDAFDALADQTLSVTTTDDDAASFSFAVSGGNTSVDESGTTDTFDVVLDRQPLSNVVIDVSSSDTGEATVDLASLTFTPANWDTTQTVTVTGVMIRRSMATRQRPSRFQSTTRTPTTISIRLPIRLFRSSQRTMTPPASATRLPEAARASRKPARLMRSTSCWTASR